MSEIFWLFLVVMYNSEKMSDRPGKWHLVAKKDKLSQVGVSHVLLWTLGPHQVSGQRVSSALRIDFVPNTARASCPTPHKRHPHQDIVRWKPAPCFTGEELATEEAVLYITNWHSWNTLQHGFVPVTLLK